MLQKRPVVSIRISALLVLGIATGLLATGPGAAARPSVADRLEARTICISERGADPFKAREFRILYGGRRAFRRCVRFHVRQVVIERRLELPTVRADCQLEARQAPLEFRLEYPGGVNQCVKLESLP